MSLLVHATINNLDLTFGFGMAQASAEGEQLQAKSETLILQWILLVTPLKSTGPHIEGEIPFQGWGLRCVAGI